VPPVSPSMLIIAGHLDVDPEQRDAYVADCAPAVVAARAAAGCLDFAITADTVARGRVCIYERWSSDAELMAFRGSGPTGDQQAAILGADVRRYSISAVGDP
jgi:quinol monooxygenase YgiN